MFNIKKYFQFERCWWVSISVALFFGPIFIYGYYEAYKQKQNELKIDEIYKTAIFYLDADFEQDSNWILSSSYSDLNKIEIENISFNSFQACVSYIIEAYSSIKDPRCVNPNNGRYFNLTDYRKRLDLTKEIREKYFTEFRNVLNTVKGLSISNSRDTENWTLTYSKEFNNSFRNTPLIYENKYVSAKNCLNHVEIMINSIQYSAYLNDYQKIQFKCLDKEGKGFGISKSLHYEAQYVEYKK